MGQNVVTANITYVDILTAIAAVAAAIIAGYTAFETRSNHSKNALISYYSTERLKDIHELKKWANILLSEGKYAITCPDDLNISQNSIRKIIMACNEFWFILKPVYMRDENVLKSLLAFKEILLVFYTENDVAKRKEMIPTIDKYGKQFREDTFLYVHSSWTCVKHQIMFGEQSQYDEFNDVYLENEETMKDLMKDKEYSDIWKL